MNWEWKKYIKIFMMHVCILRSLKTEDPKELIKTGNKEMSEVEEEEITIDDVEKAIRILKNNKADGTDGIYSELIKYWLYIL
jgi:uncharacterized membrane protein YcaP (DUF421 family)